MEIWQRKPEPWPVAAEIRASGRQEWIDRLDAAEAFARQRPCKTAEARNMITAAWNARTENAANE